MELYAKMSEPEQSMEDMAIENGSVSAVDEHKTGT